MAGYSGDFSRPTHEEAVMEVISVDRRTKKRAVTVVISVDRCTKKEKKDGYRGDFGRQTY